MELNFELFIKVFQIISVMGAVYGILMTIDNVWRQIKNEDICKEILASKNEDELSHSEANNLKLARERCELYKQKGIEYSRLFIFSVFGFFIDKYLLFILNTSIWLAEIIK